MSRVALITGGMGGLGEAVCIKMAALGYKVVTTYSPSNTKAGDWLKQMKHAPRQVFVTHGEAEAAAAMVRHVEETLHWPARVPEYMEIVQLK